MPKKNHPRLVLVSSPLTFHEQYAGNGQPSFSLVCLAASARTAGADVTIIDASAEGFDVRHTLDLILRADPDIVGISSATAGIAASGALAAGMKKVLPRTVVAIGGSHVSALPVETLREFGSFDLAVTGEGEATLRDLLGVYIQSGELPCDILGTAVRENGDIRLNSRRPFIRTLDSLPLPAWDLLSGFPRKWQPSPARMRRVPCASIMLTRGCSHHCHFCDRSVFGNTVRRYSPEYAVELFRDLRMNYGVREILVEDDAFFSSGRWLSEFCGRLGAARLDISWSCRGRADGVNFGMLRQLRTAGCWHISLGIESGDENMLRRMHKGETVQQMEHAIRLCHEAGIRTKGCILLGFPGETPETISRTKDFVLRLPLDDVSLAFVTPLPGSVFSRYSRDHGTFDGDWRKEGSHESFYLPCSLSAVEMRQARVELLRSFYFRPGVIWNKMVDILPRPMLWKPVTHRLRELFDASRLPDAGHQEKPV